ncbi:MAG: NAD(P)H-hydrate epimerase, partial [Gemmatimonadetes bacterium]|nr:NAD(P)H-hydrate epimerase [Gemmatimonadota bacterium]
MFDDGVPYGALVVEAPLASQASSFDAFAIDRIGVPQPVLMETAGRQAAHLLQRNFPQGPVVGLIGGGNNGGDALVALRTLHAWGRQVRAVFTSSRKDDDSLLHGWELPVWGRNPVGREDARDLASELDGAVVIDGMLGTGLKGVPRDGVAACIQTLNAAATRAVVALDAPSGADGSTGEVRGEAVQADLTVCFGWPKLGVLLHPARALAGRVMAVEIGFPPVAESGWARVITPVWAEKTLPRRAPDA